MSCFKTYLSSIVIIGLIVIGWALAAPNTSDKQKEERKKGPLWCEAEETSHRRTALGNHIDAMRYSIRFTIVNKEIGRQYTLFGFREKYWHIEYKNGEYLWSDEELKPPRIVRRDSILIKDRNYVIRASADRPLKPQQGEKAFIRWRAYYYDNDKETGKRIRKQINCIWHER